MEDQLIRFETAKLAQEKGFKEYCVMAYFKDAKLSLSNCYSLKDDECRSEDEVYAPTQSLLQKWLREKCNINIGLSYINCEIGEYWDWRVHSYWCYGNKQTYEQALEEALYEALKLIK